MISNLYSLQTSAPVNEVKPRPFTQLDFTSRDGYYKNYFQKSEPMEERLTEPVVIKYKSRPFTELDFASRDG